MSYLDSGFNENLIRPILPTGEPVKQTSPIIEEIEATGILPISEVAKALVSAGAMDAQAKEILGEFTFGASGAIAIATDTDNGIWLSPTGILAKKAGANTFALETDGDASFGGNLIAATGTLGALTIAEDGNIKQGKTAYTDDTHPGFWLGDVGGVAKFNMGYSATKYMHYDGEDLIVAGGTIQTNGGTTGANTKLSSAINSISFLYDNSEKAYIYADISGRAVVDANVSIYLSANNEISFFYNDNGGSDYVLWVDDGENYAMGLDGSHNLDVEGDFSANNFDFAELFEATPEFSKAKIPNGTSVVLVGDKVRPAGKKEIPLGVISATAGIVLNNGGSDVGMSWGKKYVRDENGEKVYEEKEWWSLPKGEKRTILRSQKGLPVRGWVSDGNVPTGADIRMKKTKKINPDYDPSKTYVPRRKRPEWNVVGLIGRVRILKGQPVAPNWIKLQEISNEFEEWLIK